MQHYQHDVRIITLFLIQSLKDLIQGAFSAIIYVAPKSIRCNKKPSSSSHKELYDCIFDFPTYSLPLIVARTAHQYLATHRCIKALERSLPVKSSHPPSAKSLPSAEKSRVTEAQGYSNNHITTQLCLI